MRGFQSVATRRTKAAMLWLLAVLLAPSAHAETLDPETARQLSELKAIQSRECLAKGDRTCAITKALEGLPKTFTEADIQSRPDAYEALYWAVRSRSVRLPVDGGVHASFTWPGDRVATVSMNVGSGSREPLKLWNAATGSLIAELLPPERSGTASATLGPLAFSRDGKIALHVDPKRGLPIVWDAATGQVLKELPKIPGSASIIVPKVQLSAKGTYGVVSGADGVRIYDIASGKAVWNAKQGTMAAGISPDETRVAIARAAGSSGGGEYQTIKLEVHDIADGKKSVDLSTKEPTWGAYSVIFSEDGNNVAITTSGDAVLVANLQSGAFHRIAAPRPGMAGVSFSPDGAHIAVVSADWSSTAPAVYDVETGSKVELPLGQRPALDAVYSMSGEEVGPPYFPDAGDLWRKGVTGPALYGAATAALSGEDVASPSALKPTEASGEKTSDPVAQKKGWLGVKGENVAEDPAAALGVRVTHVVPQGPCDGKLKIGDVILEADGTKLGGIADLAKVVAAFEPGKPMILKVFRDGRSDYEAIATGMRED